MPRLKRFTIENGNYHVLSRGHNKKRIFHDNNDFKKYLELVKINKSNYDVKIYHYSLLGNHIHIILASPDGELLSKMMRGINQGYAQYYRKKYGGCGYVWQDRFKSFLIEDGRYLLISGRYVELNPVIAGLSKFPEEYKWNSYRVYAFGEKNDIIDLNPEYLGLAEDIKRRRKAYREFVMEGIKKRKNVSKNDFSEMVFMAQKISWKNLRRKG